MGAGASAVGPEGVIEKPLVEWTAEEVAAAVSGYGERYKTYAETLLENRVDGETLVAEESLDDFFSELGVGLIQRKVRAWVQYAKYVHPLSPYLPAAFPPLLTIPRILLM